MAGVNLATAFITIVPTMTGVQGALAKELGGPGVGKETAAAGAAAGAGFVTAATAAVAAGAAGFGFAMKQLFDLGDTFDQMEDTIRVRTGQAGQSLQDLQQVAKDVATTVPVDFQRAADVVSNLNQTLGLTGGTLTTVSSQVAEAGRLMGEDIDIQKLSSSLSGFGVTSENASKTLDNLFQVTQSTGVGFNDLTSSLAVQGGVLQSLGFSFEDSAALIGTLTKAGVNSTTVVKSMSAGLLKLTKDGEAPAAAFERVTGEIQGMVTAGDEAAALQRAGEIFGTRGAPQLIAALKTGKINLQDMAGAIQLSGDSILELAEETNDGAESWVLFKNRAMEALEPIGTAVFNLAGKGFKALADSVDPAVASFTSLGHVLFKGDFTGPIFGLEEDSPIIGVLFTIRDAMRELWEFAGPIFREIGGTLGRAFLGIWEQLSPAIDSLLPIAMDLLSVFNPVMLLFKALLPVLPPIVEAIGEFAVVLAGGIAAALEAVAPLLQTIVDVINELMPFITELVASLLPPFLELFESLSPLLEAVLDALMPLVKTLADSLIPVIEALLPTFKTVFEFIADTIGNVIDVFQGFIDILTGIFTGDWEKVWQGVQRIFGAIWEQIGNTIGTLWTVISDFFSNIGPRIWDVISSFAGQLVEWGGQFFTWLWDGIKAVVPKVLEWFGELPGAIWDKITEFGGWLREKAREVLAWILNGIIDFFPTMVQWFLDLPGNLWNLLTEWGGTILGWGVQFLTWLRDGLVEFFPNLLAWLVALPGEIWSKLTGWGAEFLAWGWQALGWVKDGIVNFFPTLWGWLVGLPARTWEFVKEKWEEFVGWGKGIVARIVEGIKAVGGTVKDAILGLFDFDLFSTDQQVSNLRDLASGGGGFNFGGGGARGAVVPGVDPGRRDNMIMPVRSGEAVMVPEWTKAIGGARMVHAMNRAAEQGRLEELFGPGMATGGVINDGLKNYGSMMGMVAGDYARKKIKEGIDSQLAVGASNGQWGPGVSGAFAANTAAAKAFIERTFTGVSSIGGLYGGSVPGSDHPMGKALDVMIANYRSAAGIASGTKIADWFRANINAFGSKYVIWRDQIDNLRGRGWEPYSHPGGNNDTLAHRDHVHLSFLTGGGQFVPGGAPAATGGGWVGQVLAAARGAGWGQMLSNWSGSAVGDGAYPPPVPGGQFDPNVERWRPYVLEALRLTGQSASAANIVLNQIRTESSGNPRAINLTDSNAARGDPSRGLIQTILSTFNAYRLPNLSGDIYDPLSNIVAGIRYALDRYGSLAKGMRGVAYDNGGLFPPGTFGVNLTDRPEAVLTPPETDAYKAHARALLENGFSGAAHSFTFNTYLSGEEIASHTEVIMDGKLVQFAEALDEMAGRL
jgi:TP901 family phage tail tape measure protein